MTLKKIRGIYVAGIQEVIDAASKYDSNIINRGCIENQYLYSKKAISSYTGIVWCQLGGTPRNKDTFKFKFVIGCWEIYGHRKSTEEQERKFSEMFGKPVEDIIIDF